MRGALEDLLERSAFHDPALAHHRHPVRDLGDDPEVVGDEEEAHAAPALELLHQPQDLGLYRHVEGGGRLVRDQQARAARYRHRDHHPLALAAGEPVGVLVHAQLRPLDLHFRQRLDRAAPGLFVTEPGAGEADGLDDLVAHREHRVQRGHGLLEDHRDLSAAYPHQLLLGHLQEVPGRDAGLAVEAVEHLAVAAFDEVGGQQADHGERGHRLAASGFADEAEGLPRLDVEAHSVHRADRLAARPEPGVQVPNFEQRGGAAPRAPHLRVHGCRFSCER